MKLHVKAGDEVVVIAGNARGKRAKVLQVQTKKQRVLLEALEKDEKGERWINPIIKHEKGSAQNPQGKIITREAPIHLSNVMKAERYDAKKQKREELLSSVASQDVS